MGERTRGQLGPPAGRGATTQPSADPRLWWVPPSLLRGRRDRPVSVTSPAIEQLLIQAAALTSPRGRELTGKESRVLAEIFGPSVDLSRIRIVTAMLANAPTTLANQIRVSSSTSQSDAEWLSTLVHETTHVWQYQTRGSSYITDSIYHQASAASATGTRNAAYFNYTLETGRSIYDYPAEEEAQIVEDYYDITVRYAGAGQLPDWVLFRRRDIARYEDLINQVRRAIPMPESAIYERSLMGPRGAGFTDPGRDPTGVVPFLQIKF